MRNARKPIPVPPPRSGQAVSVPPCSTLSIGSRPATGARPAASTARRAVADCGRARQSGSCRASQADQAQGLGPQPSERHAAAQIRIRAKRFRYATEFFAGTFPARRAPSGDGVARCAQGCAGCSRRAQRSRHAPCADRPTASRSTPSKPNAPPRKEGSPRPTPNSLAAQSRASVRAVCRDQPFWKA